jgi:hypothetical protein
MRDAGMVVNFVAGVELHEQMVCAPADSANRRTVYEYQTHASKLRWQENPGKTPKRRGI